jgi:hypothetical protein
MIKNINFSIYFVMLFSIVSCRKEHQIDVKEFKYIESKVYLNSSVYDTLIVYKMKANKPQIVSNYLVGAWSGMVLSKYPFDIFDYDTKVGLLFSDKIVAYQHVSQGKVGILKNIWESNDDCKVYSRQKQVKYQKFKVKITIEDECNGTMSQLLIDLRTLK